MPRIARGLADGAVYHVLNRGNGGQRVFRGDSDYLCCEALLLRAKERYPLELLAYCLMPNHFHLVVRPIHGRDVSRFVQWLLTSHVRRHHRKNGTTGHVWQGRFKSFLIQEDDHLLTVMRYVERNPVRAGLTDTAVQWPWSSHAESIGERERQLTDPCPLDLPHTWSSFVNLPLTDAELQDVRKSVNRQAPYGVPEWQRHMCSEHGLQSTIRRGRPRTGA